MDHGSSLWMSNHFATLGKLDFVKQFCLFSLAQMYLRFVRTSSSSQELSSFSPRLFHSPNSCLLGAVCAAAAAQIQFLFFGSSYSLFITGEEYKLFWPDQPEFVRMAAKFGAKIVPFGSVGEDDIGELILDYNDLMSIPFIKNEIIESNRDKKKLRNDRFGVRDQDLFIPFLRPRIPGRYYYLFGKPISLNGNTEVLKDKEAANVMYLHVKSEVESIISYLLKKREEDAFRSIFQRSLFKAIWGSSHQIPSFEP